MNTHMFIITLLLSSFVIFLHAVASELLARKKTPSHARSVNYQHFVGTWQYLEPKRRRLYKVDINESYELVLNGTPINVTIISSSPSLLIFKDPYGFTMKVHYYTEDDCYLYDEANERYYRLKKYPLKKVSTIV